MTGKYIDWKCSFVVVYLSDMAMFCVVGLLDMSQSIWRHCLNKRSHTLSHNSSADLQVILIKSQAIFKSNFDLDLFSTCRLTVCVCVFRKPYHHPKENPALPVVS